MKIKKSAPNPLNADDYDLLLRMAYVICNNGNIWNVTGYNEALIDRMTVLYNEYKQKLL